MVLTPILNKKKHPLVPWVDTYLYLVAHVIVIPALDNLT